VTASLQIERTIAGLRRAVAGLRAEGRSIGLIPTMGALHEGHISLVEAARARGDAAVATIFVNPTQFSPSEDFAAYPRDEAADVAMLAAARTSLLFAPSVAEMYPEPGLTSIHVAGLTDGLCGPFRPGHFDGVATLVAKLLLAAGPDRAYFGEKDYQQLLVVQRMARDLDMAAQIVGCPTLREPDGLAKSSRNRYLSAAERARAATLYRTLQGVATEVRAGTPCRRAEAAAKAALQAAGFERIDYVSVVDAQTLANLDRLGQAAGRVVAAAYLGRARLIDNLAL